MNDIKKIAKPKIPVYKTTNYNSNRLEIYFNHYHLCNWKSFQKRVLHLYHIRNQTISRKSTFGEIYQKA